jgi:hypothetical protein
MSGRRQSYAHWPGWTQPWLTIFSGMPRTGERPLFEVSAVQSVAYDLLKIFAGMALGLWSSGVGGAALLFLPLAWILVVNASRSLTSDAHYAGHGSLTGHARIDHVVGELLTCLVASINLVDYSRGHNVIHHGREGIGWTSDPDFGLFGVIGFETGRSRQWSYLRLALTLASPRYHVLYAALRLQGNLKCTWPRALAFLTIQSLIFIVLWRIGGVRGYFLSWFLPILPLYAVSAALQFPSEHLWLARQDPGEQRADYLVRVCHGRFFLAPPPRRDGSALSLAVSWLRWFGAMAVLGLERAFVCVSILPAHDYHHHCVSARDWPMELFLRQRAIEEGRGRYHEVWGLRAAYDRQFAVWESLPRDLVSRTFTFLSLIEAVLPTRRHAGRQPRAAE